MNPQFSPFPWKRQDTSDYAHILDANNENIAMVKLPDDANLFAAAPDLLKALEEIIDLIHDYTIGWDAKEAVEATQIAKSAIAKATL